ncbi:unnamed protein product, partial [Prorocentrum cordatum]
MEGDGLRVAELAAVLQQELSMVRRSIEETGAQADLLAHRVAIIEAGPATPHGCPAPPRAAACAPTAAAAPSEAVENPTLLNRRPSGSLATGLCDRGADAKPNLPSQEDRGGRAARSRSASPAAAPAPAR